MERIRCKMELGPSTPIRFTREGTLLPAAELGISAIHSAEGTPATPLEAAAALVAMTPTIGFRPIRRSPYREGHLVYDSSLRCWSLTRLARVDWRVAVAPPSSTLLRPPLPCLTAGP